MKLLAISACALVFFTGIAHAEDADVAASKARQEQKKKQELDAAYKAASEVKKAPAAPPTLGVQSGPLIARAHRPNKRWWFRPPPNIRAPQERIRSASIESTDRVARRTT